MTSTSATFRYLTPPAIADRLAVNVDKVHAWLRRGELRGYDVSEKPGMGRPRWRIDPSDLQAFLDRRAAIVKPPAIRKKKKKAEVIQFY